MICLIALGCDGGAPAAPRKPPPSLAYLGSWGSRGDTPGALQSPLSLTADSSGTFFVLDVDSQSVAFVHKYSPDGHPLLTFAVLDSRSPSGIAVDRGGAIYSADAKGQAVHIFRPDGKPFRTLRWAGGRRLGAIAGVAVSTDGDVFLADERGCRIVKFRQRLRFAKAWGKKGNAAGDFQGPSRVAVGPDDSVYVTDAGNQRIQKFSSEGAYLASLPFPPANDPANPNPSARDGLAVSSQYVVALDAARKLLDFWTLDGQPKISLSLQGRPEIPETAALTGVTWGVNGELLVLDGGDAEILRYHLNF